MDTCPRVHFGTGRQLLARYAAAFDAEDLDAIMQLASVELR